MADENNYPTLGEAVSLTKEKKNQKTKKKEKPQAVKMHLSEFTAQPSPQSTNWANEMDLPTGPSASSSSSSNFESNRGSSLRDRPSNDSRPRSNNWESENPNSRRNFDSAPRDFPTQPPFKAYVSSLHYDVNEDDIADCFSVIKSNVSLPREKDRDQNRGFAIVEFPTLEELKAAMNLNGSNLKGRSIKVNVADPQSNRKPQGRDNYQRDNSQRDTFQRDNWRSEQSESSENRNFNRQERTREPPKAKSDQIDNWRQQESRPNENQAGERENRFGRDNRYGGERENRFGGERENRYGGERENRYGGERENRFGGERENRFGGDRENRFGGERENRFGGDRENRYGGDRQPTSQSRTRSEESSQEAPKERPRLNLMPKAATPGQTSNQTPSKPNANKPNPFGNARPVDTASKEKEIEQKKLKSPEH